MTKTYRWPVYVTDGGPFIEDEIVWHDCDWGEGAEDAPGLGCVLERTGWYAFFSLMEDEEEPASLHHDRHNYLELWGHIDRPSMFIVNVGMDYSPHCPEITMIATTPLGFVKAIELALTQFNAFERAKSRRWNKAVGKIQELLSSCNKRDSFRSRSAQ